MGSDWVEGMKSGVVSGVKGRGSRVEGRGSGTLQNDGARSACSRNSPVKSLAGMCMGRAPLVSDEGGTTNWDNTLFRRQEDQCARAKNFNVSSKVAGSRHGHGHSSRTEIILINASAEIIVLDLWKDVCR